MCNYDPAVRVEYRPDVWPTWELTARFRNPNSPYLTKRSTRIVWAISEAHARSAAQYWARKLDRQSREEHQWAMHPGTVTVQPAEPDEEE